MVHLRNNTNGVKQKYSEGGGGEEEGTCTSATFHHNIYIYIYIYIDLGLYPSVSHDRLANNGL